MFTDGHGLSDSGRCEQPLDALGFVQGFFDIALGLGGKGDGFAASLGGEVEDASGFDTFFVFEVVEVVEELHPGGGESAAPFFDFVDLSVFGEVEAEEVVYEDVFLRGVGIGVGVDVLAEGDAFLSGGGGGSGGVFLFDAVGVPPEFSGTEDGVVDFGAADAQVAQGDGAGGPSGLSRELKFCVGSVTAINSCFWIRRIEC